MRGMMKPVQWVSLALAFALAFMAGCNGDDPDGDSDVECPAVTFTGDGADPDEFVTDDLLLGIDTIYPAFAAGKKFIFIDARPPSDYVLHHIRGAISLPYYDAGSCAAELPKDVWIVTYCGCPHTESMHAAEVLKDNGFEKVKVLDEGYFEWRDCGYPTSDFPDGDPEKSCDDS